MPWCRTVTNLDGEIRVLAIRNRLSQDELTNQKARCPQNYAYTDDSAIDKHPINFTTLSAFQYIKEGTRQALFCDYEHKKNIGVVVEKNEALPRRVFWRASSNEELSRDAFGKYNTRDNFKRSWNNQNFLKSFSEAEVPSCIVQHNPNEPLMWTEGLFRYKIEEIDGIIVNQDNIKSLQKCFLFSKLVKHVTNKKCRIYTISEEGLFLLSSGDLKTLKNRLITEVQKENLDQKYKRYEEAYCLQGPKASVLKEKMLEHSEEIKRLCALFNQSIFENQKTKRGIFEKDLFLHEILKVKDVLNRFNDCLSLNYTNVANKLNYAFCEARDLVKLLNCAKQFNNDEIIAKIKEIQSILVEHREGVLVRCSSLNELISECLFKAQHLTEYTNRGIALLDYQIEFDNEDFVSLGVLYRINAMLKKLSNVIINFYENEVYHLSIDESTIENLQGLFNNLSQFLENSNLTQGASENEGDSFSNEDSKYDFQKFHTDLKENINRLVLRKDELFCKNNFLDENKNGMQNLYDALVSLVKCFKGLTAEQREAATREVQEDWEDFWSDYRSKQAFTFSDLSSSRNDCSNSSENELQEEAAELGSDNYCNSSSGSLRKSFSNLKNDWSSTLENNVVEPSIKRRSSV